MRLINYFEILYHLYTLSTYIQEGQIQQGSSHIATASCCGCGADAARKRGAESSLVDPVQFDDSLQFIDLSQFID